MTYNKLQPGVHKLLRHPEHLAKIKQGVLVAPLHVSLWPTVNCQLNCQYCCCKNMKTLGNELTWEQFTVAIDTLSKYGTKAIEYSGGGEPLLWPYFEKSVDYAFSKGLKLSLITNGLLLNEISTETLKKFSWIRVSVQSPAHMKSISYKRIPTQVSCSYIIGNNVDPSVLDKFHAVAKQENIILRVAIERPADEGREAEICDTLLYHELRDYLFFSDKESGTPLGCYMAWVRAAIDWRGNFLPCPSIQLNEETKGFIPDDFILCRVEDLETWLFYNTPSDLGFKCKFCNCGKENNDFIHNLLKDEPDDEFV